jgi:uncharacterized protein
MSSGVHSIGLISDTHGMLRTDVIEAFAGVDRILHAGDVGDGVLEELALIAPVRAVCGNVDDPGDPRLAKEIDEIIGGVRVHVSHGHELGVPSPDRLLEAYNADIIVYGHTHRPLAVHAGRRWVVNPGAAGPRRFDILPSVATLRISDGDVTITHVPLRA